MNEENSIEVKGVITGKIPEPETEIAFKQLINRLKEENGLTFGESIKFILDNLLLNGINEDLEKTSKIKQINQYTSMITTSVIDLINSCNVEKSYIQENYIEKIKEKDINISKLQNILEETKTNLKSSIEEKKNLLITLEETKKMFDKHKNETLPGLYNTINDKENIIKYYDETIIEQKYKIQEFKNQIERMEIIKQENTELKSIIDNLKKEMKDTNNIYSQKEIELNNKLKEKDYLLKEAIIEKEKELQQIHQDKIEKIQQSHQQHLDKIQEQYSEKLTNIIDRYIKTKEQ